MNFAFSTIVNQAKEIIFNPRSFWMSKKESSENLAKLFGSYLLPLFMAVSLAVFLGEFFRSSHFYMGFAVLKALRKLMLFGLTYFISVYFTTTLMKTFGAEKRVDIAQQLVAYSLTPFLIISMVTGLFPFLYVLDILGVYGFYIFWIGASELLVLPEQKRDSYIILTIVVNFFIFSFLSIILSKLLEFYY